MNAFTSACSPRGGLLFSAALLSLGACSRPAPDAAARARAGFASSVVNVDRDAGVFLPVTEQISVQSAATARSSSLLVIEKDISGGNMLRLNGRFSGELRAVIAGGTLRSECQSPGHFEARATP